MANDGTVSVAHQFGTQTEGTITVTQESSMSVGASFGVSFGIPGLEGGEAETSLDASMTNSLSKAFVSFLTIVACIC